MSCLQKILMSITVDAERGTRILPDRGEVGLHIKSHRKATETHTASTRRLTVRGLPPHQFTSCCLLTTHVCPVMSVLSRASPRSTRTRVDRASPGHAEISMAAVTSEF